MNKRAFIITSAIAVLVILGGGFALLRYNAPRNVPAPVSHSEQRTPSFVLLDALTDLVQSKKSTNEVTNYSCLGQLYDHAIKTKFNFAENEADVTLLQRTVDCAQSNNVDNYKSLAQGLVIPQKDLPERLKTLACIFSPDYKRTIFENSRSEFSAVYEKCLASEQHSEVGAILTQNPGIFQKGLTFCEGQIAEYLSDTVKYNTCRSWNSEESHPQSYACLALNSPDIDKSYSLSPYAVKFIKEGETELLTATKVYMVAPCLNKELFTYIAKEGDFPRQYFDESGRPLSEEKAETGMMARDEERMADARQLVSALELYYNDANTYPETLQFGRGLMYKQTTYMAIVPVDPLDQEIYHYSYEKTDGGYLITINMESGDRLEVTPNGIKTL